MPKSVSQNKSLLALFAITCFYVQPSPAENPAANPVKKTVVSTAKAAVKDNGKSTEAAALPVKSKKTASFGDAPVGAKTTDELVKKLESAYKNRDSGAYLAILKAPVRTGIRMELQFRRESKVPCSNFHYASVAGEADRLKVKPDTLTKARDNKGIEEVFDVPVCGFIDYDVRNNPQAPPDVIGMPVGKDKGSYFVITRHPVEGTAKTGTAAPGAPTNAAAPAGTPAKAAASAAASAKAH